MSLCDQYSDFYHTGGRGQRPEHTAQNAGGQVGIMCVVYIGKKLFCQQKILLYKTAPDFF